jgi:two-component system, chemotaxis family, protein-glutamate methylesterase/glutaminase
MILNKDFYFKWIDGASVSAHEIDQVLISKCVIYCSNANNQVVGFSFFEPRDLNIEMFERLNARMRRPEFVNCKFSLCAPNYILHRAESILKNEALEIIETPFVKIQYRAGHFTIRHHLRIVNVDDSPVLLKFLKHNLEEMKYIDVVGQISKSTEAVEQICRLKPDLVTMDIQMPGMTGIDVVKQLLAKEYFPVIMISSVSLEEGTLVFNALNAGAFDYIQKPRIEEREEFKEALSDKILAAIDGKVAHLKIQQMRAKTTPVKKSIENQAYASNLIWCLGSSTGGTQALTQVFTSMPSHIPPTLIVQHIPPVFSKAFADSLNQLCPFKVIEAEAGMFLEPDTVYIAPGGLQMGVKKIGERIQISISDSEPVNRFKPSVDYLFKSAAALSGNRIVAALLTGMGKDGAQGLLELKKSGALTLAQDEKSCTVYGMPRAAYEIGAVDSVVSIEEMATAFLQRSHATQRAS